MQEIWKTVITPEGVYENYKVSNLGRVKSLNYRNTGKEKLLSLSKDRNGYFQVRLSKNSIMKTFRIHRLLAYAFIPNIMGYNCIDHRDTNPQNNNLSNLVWVTQKQNNNNELTRKKRSESLKKEKHPMFGKHLSDEHRKNISKAKTGKTLSEETKIKMSKTRKGKHHTEEHKKKISESHKGKHFSDETKNKISVAKNKKVICLETGKIFASTLEVERQLNINNSNISLCCNRKYKQSKKLTFRYLDQVLFYN